MPRTRPKFGEGIVVRNQVSLSLPEKGYKLRTEVFLPQRTQRDLYIIFSVSSVSEVGGKTSIERVFVVDNLGRCCFAGYVGWIHRAKLYQTWQQIRNDFPSV
ncbi:MAG: hypothetical protein RLZZ338_2315 [Cyanobacteriota bacterium]